MQSRSVLYGTAIQRHQEKYAAGATVCPKEIEMRRKVSAHRNCEGNQYDLPREAGILSQVFDDRTIKGKIKERLYDPV
nr:MAG TPA: hypothetical protein [Caudoviricetes sp.]